MTSHLLPAPCQVAGRSDLLERRLRRYHPRAQGAVRALASTALLTINGLYLYAVLGQNLQADATEDIARTLAATHILMMRGHRRVPARPEKEQ